MEGLWKFFLLDVVEMRRKRRWWWRKSRLIDNFKFKVMKEFESFISNGVGEEREREGSLKV